MFQGFSVGRFRRQMPVMRFFSKRRVMTQEEGLRESHLGCGETVRQPRDALAQAKFGLDMNVSYNPEICTPAIKTLWATRELTGNLIGLCLNELCNDLDTVTRLIAIL